MTISAAWKIVKSWLGPEAISKLRFASKSEVQGFIGPEYLPPHMGGTVCFYSRLNVQFCTCPTLCVKLSKITSKKKLIAKLFSSQILLYYMWNFLYRAHFADTHAASRQQHIVVLKHYINIHCQHGLFPQFKNHMIDITFAFQDPFTYSYPPLPDDDFQICDNGPVVSEDETESRDADAESKDTLESSFNSEVAVKPKKVL